MSFEEWHETYERDGGELMLYNTIDLEAAYNAGVQSTTPYTEGYAKGYSDGAQAERERCARVAETHRDAGCVVSVSGQTIAAAIREG